jgi:aldose sugar dehydrogenase
MMNRTLCFSILLFGFLSSCTSPSSLDLPVLDYVALDESTLKVEVLADNLDVPWDLEYVKDGFLWFNEQGGTISRINLESGELQRLLTIEEVWRQRTSGLLGLAIHQDFPSQPYIVVNYTVKADSLISNKLVRYTFDKERLVNPVVLLTVPGNTAHNGARLKFTQNGQILWATGDAYGFDNPQNDESLNGKILRINLDGSIPKDNPNPNSYVFAKGFRNIQGLTISPTGTIYTSEHGDAIEDEINRILPSGNYGWPVIEGFHDLEAELDFANIHHTREPIHAWTPVVAPAGLDFYGNLSIKEWKNSLLLTTLKGKSLRVLKLSEDGTTVLEETVFFENHYGRLRDVAVGAAGELYLATSNRDWNPQPGFPLEGDDKILKISLTTKASKEPMRGQSPHSLAEFNGKQLYLNYCASCHKEDGAGVKNIFPSLVNNPVVVGEQGKLVSLLLHGVKNPSTGLMMPAFAFMNDQELAAILTYIRQNWGNLTSTIPATSITEKR